MQIAKKGIKAYDLTLNESDDLNKVDRLYTQYFDGNLNPVRVQIAYHLETRTRTAEDDGILDDGEEFALPQARIASQTKTSGSNQRQAKGKQRTTATTRLQAEEGANLIRDAASDSYALEIAKNNRCSKSNCPNKGYACIAYGDQAHIRLSSDILKKWDKAIRKKEATTLEPPRVNVPSVGWLGLGVS